MLRQVKVQGDEIVKVGDFVSFKQDYEKIGKLTSIKDGWLTIVVDEGYGGERYSIHKTDAWVE
jgi:hypothetical protein|tara:strand:+ start:290 stop:478 length:189 start_codon:yes stop_codon:yes gene_type:complete